MELKIKFPGASRVDAEYGNLNIVTNQDGTAPPPFALFLASIGTCAGIYVKNFCDQRGISAENIEIIQKMERDPVTRMISNITLDINLPEDFPVKYKEAVIRAADLCAVKKHLVSPPDIKVYANLKTETQTVNV
ncbi:OsmC family protein [candidate division KSB1 bacterium]|nr:OsmC family protein [candidate division KSB1 bacterium]